MPQHDWVSEIGREWERDTWEGTLGEILERGGPFVIYRGQGDYKWPLSCTLSRSLRDEARNGGPVPLDALESLVVDERLDEYVHMVETRLLRTFIALAPSLGLYDPPPIADRLAWWELMQHHGAPTRLLDWTKSPFIALWFALEFHHRDEDSDAALWVFDTGNSWVNYFKVLDDLEAGDWSTFLADREIQNKMAEQAIASRNIVPAVIAPRRDVARVAAQQSAMTLIPDIRMPTEAGHSVFASLATKVRIRAEWRPAIRSTFTSLGIDRFQLFRDMDALGEALHTTLVEHLPLPEL